MIAESGLSGSAPFKLRSSRVGMAGAEHVGPLRPEVGIARKRQRDAGQAGFVWRPGPLVTVVPSRA